MGELANGKLPADLLAGLLTGLHRADPAVRIGPAVGEDAAVVDVGSRSLVVATDPITFVSERGGWYAVHVNANDVACCGADPRWFTVNVLLPPGSADDTVRALMADIDAACADLGVTVIGGHTEITDAVRQPVVVGQMLGETEPGHIIATANARPGDALVLSGGIAIEGTAIICRELPRLLTSLDPSSVARGAALLDDPGISVLPAARLVRRVDGVHALHDPTEGGLAGALAELCAAAGTGVEIDQAAVPMVPGCAAVCTAAGVDPLGLIASGALLIACAAEALQATLAVLAGGGIRAAHIGHLTRTPDRVLLRDGRRVPLPQFERDEIARLFDTC